jgi:phosphate:Na+ symporter
VVADFHTVFNLVMAILFLPLLRPFARMLVWLLPARAASTDPSQPIYLSEAACETPAIALAGAARKALRMVDVLEAMLRGALDALDGGDRRRVTDTKALDDVLDRKGGRSPLLQKAPAHSVARRRREKPSGLAKPE